MTKKTDIYHNLIRGGVVSLMMVVVVTVSVNAEEPPIFALTWGSTGSGDGYFDDARRLVTDTAGNVLVSDYYTNNYIQKFSPTGEVLLAFAPG